MPWLAITSTTFETIMISAVVGVWSSNDGLCIIPWLILYLPQSFNNPPYIPNFNVFCPQTRLFARRIHFSSIFTSNFLNCILCFSASPEVFNLYGHFNFFSKVYPFLSKSVMFSARLVLLKYVFFFSCYEIIKSTK